MTNLLTKSLLITTLSASLLFTGCVSGPGGGGITPQQGSVITGSVLGGVAGAQIGKGRGRTAATVLGAVLGGYLGGVMSNQSRQRANYAFDSVPNNQSQTWVEPQTNNRYTVTPTRTYNAANGQQCRDYNMDAYIDGRLQQVTGRACKDANGRWVATR